tara:strand:+ start:93 stop:593 length:501 start_codon:yes stop_codon:yes gene_type:complete
MWALIKDNLISEIIDKAKPMTIDGIKHSSQIFTLWSDAQREAVGLYKIQNGGSEKSTTFYTNTYKDEFKDSVVTRTYTNTAQSVSDIKTSLISQINFTLSIVLSGTDWIVIREQETSEAKPSNLAAWRTNLRTKHAELETAINNASSVSALEAVDIDSGWPKDPRT